MIRIAVTLAIAVGAIAAACRNDVPGPAIPTPLAPEVTRDAPRPKPIDPKKQRPAARKVSVSEAPQDAGVHDAVHLPPNPDAAVTVVRDAGQPLK